MLNLKTTFELSSALKSIKEQLRRNQGSAACKPQLLFSYFEPLASSVSGLDYLSQYDGREPARTTTVFPHPLQLRCTVTQGCVEMHWTFDQREHSDSAIQKFSDVFCENLQNLIQHSQSSEGAVYTPSDFPEAELSQEELDKFLGLLGRSTGGGL